MIGFLRGIILDKEPSYLLLEVTGIGYEIQIPLTCFTNLPSPGKECSLYIHLATRDDGEYLYGFSNKTQRALFRSLIKVSGVGPKIALAILSAMEPQLFATYLVNNNAQALEKISGVGAKTARRLITEMKDRASEWSGSLETTSMQPTASHDAISALIALGYKPPEAQRAIDIYGEQNLSSEELIRAVLKKIK